MMMEEMTENKIPQWCTATFVVAHKHASSTLITNTDLKPGQPDWDSKARPS